MDNQNIIQLASDDAQVGDVVGGQQESDAECANGDPILLIYYYWTPQMVANVTALDVQRIRLWTCRAFKLLMDMTNGSFAVKEQLSHDQWEVDCTYSQVRIMEIIYGVQE